MQVTFEQLRDGFASGLPLVKALGITLEEMAPGELVMSLPNDPALVGDPASGVIHGGAVSILLDTCLGTAVWVHPENEEATATIDLRVNYMRPARPGHKLFARAKVYHVTRTVAFAQGTAWEISEDKPVATASGTFTFKRRAKDAS